MIYTLYYKEIPNINHTFSKYNKKPTFIDMSRMLEFHYSYSSNTYEGYITLVDDPDKSKSSHQINCVSHVNTGWEFIVDSIQRYNWYDKPKQQPAIEKQYIEKLQNYTPNKILWYLQDKSEAFTSDIFLLDIEPDLDKSYLRVFVSFMNDHFAKNGIDKFIEPFSWTKYYKNIA